MSEPVVGEVVDVRYELRRLIARGGMGLVFEAHHRFTRRTVALKALPDELVTQSEAKERLLREAHALTTVRHPGFVEVLDAGVCADHGPYVVLEMLEGRTLEGILAARRRLTLENAIQLGRQLCEAVAHANARGVIHRDIKPSNVFVARNEVGLETVKIIDLGVAAVAEGHLAAHDRKLTTAHAVIGTPEYMAPEQLWGHEVDARTDVYAIGMTLYECLTGEVPHTGSYPEVLVRVSNATEPPRVRSKRADVPPAVALVIETALEKDASARFQTAAELGRALVASSGLALRWTSLLAASADEAVSPTGKQDEEPERAIKLVRKKARPGEVEAPVVAAQPGREASKEPSRRRQFVRAPYVTPVLLVSPADSEVDARSEEISEEGMLVVSPQSFALGAVLKLRFASPTTGEMIVLSASVRWTREGRGRTAMGLEFIHAPPALRTVVASYIATLPRAPG
ncbi:MAG TPA: serine/threonine-protein kinase [Polyangiaceae bacterium]|nr:serine/threonine-protein kinase [Polyangiaceae bacterium]